MKLTIKKLSPKLIIIVAFVLVFTIIFGTFAYQYASRSTALVGSNTSSNVSLSPTDITKTIPSYTKPTTNNITYELTDWNASMSLPSTWSSSIPSDFVDKDMTKCVGLKSDNLLKNPANCPTNFTYSYFKSSNSANTIYFQHGIHHGDGGCMGDADGCTTKDVEFKIMQRTFIISLLKNKDGSAYGRIYAKDSANGLITGPQSLLTEFYAFANLKDTSDENIKIITDILSTIKTADYGFTSYHSVNNSNSWSTKMPSTFTQLPGDDQNNQIIFYTSASESGVSGHDASVTISNAANAFMTISYKDCYDLFLSGKGGAATGHVSSKATYYQITDKSKNYDVCSYYEGALNSAQTDYNYVYINYIQDHSNKKTWVVSFRESQDNKKSISYDKWIYTYAFDEIVDSMRF